MSKTPIYSVWRAMHDRCERQKSPAFKNYGARGITVCDRWRSFEPFLEDMGIAPDGTELDRIDNDKGYSPDNCRWATRVQQARNRRGVIRISFGGVEQTIQQWADHLDLKYSTVYMRLFFRKWSVEKSLGLCARHEDENL